MAERIYRELPKETKEKISKAMQAYHKRKSSGDAMITRNKQAAAMRKYWATIPHQPENVERDADGDLSMNAFLNGGHF